ncbi:MAG: type II toxin-antitoxin system RelE/ParE family toxin [Thermoplasmata archaeon]|nr:type II toxin-antitoxin system RelE/ParE family toxin [Thermoplasmata archaeon]
MTKFRVFISETARRQLNSLHPDMRKQIKKKLRKLEEDPYRARAKVDIKKLKGPNKDYFRLRIGNYRAIYVIDGNKVKIAKILPRSKAYDWIE